MNFHKSIDTLPYGNFLQAREKGDIRYIFELESYLDLSKCKPNEEHLKAFSNIMEEYNDELLKRDRAKDLFEIEKEVGELNAERLLCQLYVSQIKIFWHVKDEYKELIDKCIADLSELGYDFNGNIEALEGQIDRLLNEIDDLELAKNNHSGSGKGATPEEMIDAIEQYRKIPIDINKTSVKQYITYENGYLKYLANLKNKK